MFTCLEHSVDGRSTATRGGVGGVKVRRLMTVQSIGPYIATAIAATVGDPRNFASGRHFAAWLGLTPKQHSNGRKRKAWRNKQARRQLYPSVTHSWRSGDRGSRAERSDEERLALRASGAAAFQRRHRRLGKQDRSCRMGGHVDRANLSKGRLIAGRPTVSAVRGQTDA